MIYLNQAATSWPKPESVLAAYEQSVRALPSSQFRSSAGLQTATRSAAAGDSTLIGNGGAVMNDDVIGETRQVLGKLVGIRDTGRIFFSSGATDSANAIVYGLPFDSLAVFATETEHNSVLRPLLNLVEPVCGPQNGDVRIIPCDETGYVAPEAAARALEGICKPAAVFVNHMSNVTGRIQNIAAIARVVHQKDAILIVDAAQSAGCIPICVDEWGIDALILTGHKSLYGMQGTGAYYVRDGIPFRPYRYGGTGRDSRKLYYSDKPPFDYEYEVGTQNGPGIAALGAGARYCLERGVDAIAAHERGLMSACSCALREIPGVTVYGHGDSSADSMGQNAYGPVLSFNIDGMKAGDVAYILQNAYGIVVRAGLQCAPLIHQEMGTYENGTVRVSVSDMNTMAEIEELVRAVREIAGSVGAAAGHAADAANDVTDDAANTADLHVKGGRL